MTLNHLYDVQEDRATECATTVVSIATHACYKIMGQGVYQDDLENIEGEWKIRHRRVNGGLFDGDTALPLTADDIALCLCAALLDWSEIDPSIFGTLFVRGLDPDKRSETGAEYTDREKIMMIIEPVITRPLLREWETVRDGIVGMIKPAEDAVEEAIPGAMSYPELAEEVRAVESRLTARPQLELFGDLAKQKRVRALDAVRRSLRAADRALTDATEQGLASFNAFLARLRAFRVLDPACGSGNFLYLALVELKNIERRVAIEGELLGFPPRFPSIGPEALLGIEINRYAAELARQSMQSEIGISPSCL